MQKNMIIAVSGGGLSAVASMAFLTGTPGALFFAYLATLPIFMVAFSMGPLAATVAGLSGFVFAALLGGTLSAGIYGMVHALPAWLVSRQSLLQSTTPTGQANWFPVGSILGSLSLFCAGFLTGTGLFVMSNVDTLRDMVGQYLHEAFSFMAPAMTGAELQAVVDMLASIFPGAMGASWVLMLVINALVAQSVLVRLGKNLRPSPRLADMILPQWLAWPMVIMAAIGLLASGDIRYVAQNAAIVLAVPYFFLGIAVVHWAVRRLTFATPLLVGFYLILFLSGWALLLVAALGMAEQWAGLRDRFSTTDHDQSST